VGHVARLGGKRNVCRLLVGKPEGKGPLGRLGNRWVDNDIDWMCVICGDNCSEQNDIQGRFCNCWRLFLWAK
jgi:hypothetical protein